MEIYKIKIYVFDKKYLTTIHTHQKDNKKRITFYHYCLFPDKRKEVNIYLNVRHRIYHVVIKFLTKF